MSSSPSIDNLIKSLGAQASPVRRLWSPGWRTVGWVVLIAAIAAYLLHRYGMGGMMQRWSNAPDQAWASICSVVTGVTAAFAAFVVAVPGRHRAWMWLPVPSAVLWLGASGWGCLTHWSHVFDGAGVMPGGADCLAFIVLSSVPLSALLIWLLRRACPLRPVLAACMIGLASAATSAALLSIFHPYSVAAGDLLMHGFAILLVVGANAAMGGRLLQPR